MSKIADLKRPDLAYISCALCGEAWQDPEPPDLPALEAEGPLPVVGYLEAVEQHGRFLGGDPELARAADAGHVERWERVIHDREMQAVAYRLSDAAVAASRKHAEQAHTLDEHLAHAHANQIPLACERCGHQEQATQEGVEALKAHVCPARGEECTSCAGQAGVRAGKHLSAYPA